MHADVFKPSCSLLRHSISHLSLALCAVWIIIGIVGNGEPSSVLAQEPPQLVPISFADIAEQISPTVVNISTSHIVSPALNLDSLPQGQKLFEWFFDGSTLRPGVRRRSLGSGVIIDPAGYIITNNHVANPVEGEGNTKTEITVVLNTTEEFKADVVGRDPYTDIALLQLKGNFKLTDNQIAKLGDSDKLKKGDILIFDELGSVRHPTHEFRAFIDVMSSYKVGYEVIGSADFCYRVAVKLI